MRSRGKRPIAPRGVRGFTLTETLLGVAITCIMGILLWNMFITTTTQMDKSTWLSSSEAKARATVQHLGILARSASYPTQITPSTVNHDLTSKVDVAAGVHNAGANDKLLSFKICVPQRSGFPDPADNGPNPAVPDLPVEIWLKGNKLEQHENGAFKKVLLEDVLSVELKDKKPGGDEKSSVLIVIITRHPNPKFKNTKVEHTGSLAFNIGMN